MRKKKIPGSCGVASLGDRLLSLKQSAILSDVTVVCGDGISIQAHKCILSASSLYFKSIFTNSLYDQEEAACLKSVDISKDITTMTAHIDAVIEYMYTGYVDLKSHNLAAIVRLAYILECSDVLEICMEYTKRIFDKRHCLQAYLDLDQLGREGIPMDDSMTKAIARLWNLISKSWHTDQPLKDHILKGSTEDMLLLLSCVDRHGHLVRFLQIAIRWLNEHQDQTALKIAEILTDTVTDTNQILQPSDLHHMKRCAPFLVRVLRKMGKVVPEADALIQKIEQHFGIPSRNEIQGVQDGEKPSGSDNVNHHGNHDEGSERKDCRENTNPDACNMDDLDEEIKAENKSLGAEHNQTDEAGNYLRTNDTNSDSSKPLGNVSEQRQRRRKAIFPKKSWDIKIEDNFESIYGEYKTEPEDDDDEYYKGLVEGVGMVEDFFDNDSDLAEAFEASLADDGAGASNAGLDDLSTNTAAKTEKCVVCGQMFARLYHLVFHMKKLHMDVVSFKCTICSETVEQPKNIFEHARAHRKMKKEDGDAPVFKDKHGKKVFKCKQCRKTFSRKAGYQRHTMIHSSDRPFICAQCGYSFVTKCKLKLHNERVHMGIALKEHSCERCGVNFSNQNNLDEHQKTCEGKKLACEICGKRFMYQVYLDRHLVSHTEKRIHKCDKCHRSFKHDQNLRAHVLMKHENTGKTSHSSICDHCGKVLKNRNCLRRHLLTHMAERPYKCPQCPKSYTQSTGLDTHMRFHTGEKPFQCEICSEMFGIKCNLDRHIQRHLGDKPYKCGHCVKAFVQFTDLQRHETVHTGEKKYSCRFCGKCFSLKKTVVIHERRHSGDRPYKCRTCSKSFVTTFDLRRHEKTHSADKPTATPSARRSRPKLETYDHSQHSQHSQHTMDSDSRISTGIPTMVPSFMDQYQPQMDSRMSFPPMNMSMNRNNMGPLPMPPESTGHYVPQFPGYY